MDHQTSFVSPIAYNSPQSSTQPMTEFSQINSSLIVPVSTQRDDPIAWRKGQSYSGTGYKGNATSLGGNNAGGQARMVKCYKFQGEGHMARQCAQPKRPRKVVWFNKKAMLAEALKSDQILDEEPLAFLVDSGIPDGQVAQTTIPNTADFQTKDLDAYDPYSDDDS
nr:hypothetical protein [Tanacetum cinerariifolium]